VAELKDWGNMPKVGERRVRFGLDREGGVLGWEKFIRREGKCWGGGRGERNEGWGKGEEGGGGRRKEKEKSQRGKKKF